MAYGVINSDLITTSDGVSSAGLYGLKNRLINGSMSISQGAAGATITPAVTSAYATNYPVDRFQVIVGAASKLTTAQSSVAATGFNFSTLITSSSAYTVGAGEVFVIRQNIEGFNTADLGWGAAGAAAVTLSFWVRSSLTGTFGGSLQNSASNRSYPFTYSIAAANTWELKSVTIAGDTTGTWIGATNGIGLRVNFGLGVGSTFSGTAGAWAGSDFDSATGATSVVGTNGATFYITGVQLEKGSTATSFDYLDYGRSLIQCKRYYQFFGTNGAFSSGGFGAGYSHTSTTARIQLPGFSEMRSQPTMTFSSQTDFSVLNSAGNQATTVMAALSNSQFSATLTATAASQTAGQGVILSDNGAANAKINLSAEL
jgi:hypothetical protein